MGRCERGYKHWLLGHLTKLATLKTGADLYYSHGRNDTRIFHMKFISGQASRLPPKTELSIGMTSRSSRSMPNLVILDTDLNLFIGSATARMKSTDPRLLIS
jgi:hypothetical protein